MDRLIKRYDHVVDDDLVLCLERGVAFQRDMRQQVPYDAEYFNKCASYEGQEIALKINAGRVALVNEYVGPDEPVIDVGIGSGEFIKNRPNTFGYDINPVARDWLKKQNLWVDNITTFRAFTFWDVLEHVELPENYLRTVGYGGYLFACVPILSDLKCIRDSRHYRPGEHLYYWTEEGFIDWMGRYGFEVLTVRDYETKAGRESILSFAFKRSDTDHNYMVSQYQKLHDVKHYGASAGLYLDLVASEIISMNPSSILDYGCGRSDLAVRFWNDGGRQIERYDPAIPEFATMPKGEFDLVLCCDVMEHIQMRDVDKILSEIREKSSRALFVISLRLARAHLPDGQNAHVTLLTKNEWRRWLLSYFPVVNEMATPWDHVYMVKTW
jgi:hypothetical protein